MIKKSFLILIALFLSVNSAFAEKPQKYMPYPIVFVSGITTHSTPGTKGSPSEKWPSTWLFHELKKNFSDVDVIVGEITNIYDTEVQSQEGEIPHLEFFFYDARQAPLEYNANLLKDGINKILSSEGGYYKINNYTYTEPCSTPKVILVCHSYGGVIARYMLAREEIYKMQNKVAAVFFIGVPQEGSPLSVIGYFLPKEIPIIKEEIGKLDKLIKGSNPIAKRVYAHLKKKMESKITGNLKFMIWAENDEGHGGSLYTSTRDENDTKNLLVAISGNRKWLKLYKKLPYVKEKGTVKATLIPNELANKYSHTFKTHYDSKGPYGTEKVVVERTVPSKEPLSYPLSESELSTLGTDIGKDIKKYAIVGTRVVPIREGLIGKANINIGKENFNRYDYSCVRNRFWENGDGVVNLASQKVIPGASSQNTHEIDAIHTSIGLPIWGPLPFLGGELDHSATPNTILQAIDDKPVIEDVRIVRFYGAYGYLESTYLIVKVQDYLLADVEFTVNGIYAENLNEYQDPVTGAYKPYLKGKENKEFLKERDEPIKDKAGNIIDYLHLLPGEFYLKIFDSYPTGSIKIKNPADKETECRIYYPTGTFATFKYVATATSLSYYPIYPPDFIIPPSYPIPQWHAAIGDWAVPYSEFRTYAYNTFLTSPLWFSTDDNVHPPGDTQGRGITANVHGYGRWEALGYNYGYVTSASRTLIAYVENLNFINFPVDTSGKTIRTAKLTGYIDKKLEGGGTDFNISLYRDSTNTWPASQNSSGDTLLFSIATSLYQDGAQFEAVIDPTNINPNGNNVWQTRSDLLDFALHNNFLPQSIPYDLDITFIGASWAHFKRSVYIKNPALIVIYE